MGALHRHPLLRGPAQTLTCHLLRCPHRLAALFVCPHRQLSMQLTHPTHLLVDGAGAVVAGAGRGVVGAVADAVAAAAAAVAVAHCPFAVPCEK